MDFRQGEDGQVYLIELNPRFFGGLPQAVAANVDYPHLLFRIATGEQVEPPDIDYAVRTEAPLVGLLATLEEIAHDDRVWNRFRTVRDELSGRIDHGADDNRLRPIWQALKESANPRDLKAYFREMFATHAGTINDVLQSDDPAPMLGVLFPVALALRKGEISMSVLAGEKSLEVSAPDVAFAISFDSPVGGRSG